MNQESEPPKSPVLPRPAGWPPDWWLFLTKFLQQGRGIAALVPSSRWLARTVVQGIDFARAGCIVELGAGTGPITTELLRRSGECRTLIIERDPDFCARLRSRFPRADIVQADALQLERVLAERGIEAVSHIISGLPLPSFTPADRDALLRVVGRLLAPEGTFRQLTHMPWVYYKLYHGYFQEVQFRLTLRNLPPGGCYVCRNRRKE
jgi:phospholipid N-methyltransferase